MIRAGAFAAGYALRDRLRRAHAKTERRAHRDPFPRVFHALRPSVVLFTMNVPSDDATQGQFDEAYGSGLIVASGPWGSQILTVEHVIHDARDLRATIGDRRKVKAHTIAADEKNDLALVATDTPNLTVAPSAVERTRSRTRDRRRGLSDPRRVRGRGSRHRDFGVLRTHFERPPRRARTRRADHPGRERRPGFRRRDGAVIGLAESRFDEEKAIGFAIPIDDAKAFIAHAKGARVAQAR